VETGGFGVAHDLTRVADGLQIAGDEFIERCSFRAGDLDDTVSRRSERHIGNDGSNVVRRDGLEQAAAASAARRLRPEVSKNSSTALSSNEGELARSITTCAPAMAFFNPSPVMVLTPVFGAAATASWPPLQNGDGLRADQAGAADDDDFHGLLSRRGLKTLKCIRPMQKSRTRPPEK
jgi:hypothetical protein